MKNENIKTMTDLKKLLTPTGREESAEYKLFLLFVGKIDICGEKIGEYVIRVPSKTNDPNEDIVFTYKCHTWELDSFFGVKFTCSTRNYQIGTLEKFVDVFTGDEARDVLESVKSTVVGDSFDGSKITCLYSHFLRHYNNLRCPYYIGKYGALDEFGDIVDDGKLNDALIDKVTINFKPDHFAINKTKQITLKYHEELEQYEIVSITYYPFEELSTTRVEEENSFYDVCR